MGRTNGSVQWREIFYYSYLSRVVHRPAPDTAVLDNSFSDSVENATPSETYVLMKLIADTCILSLLIKSNPNVTRESLA